MRDNLKAYIDLLFAGAPQSAQTAETKAEILQNTLDKYDDLIDQGETPQAAYSMAVAGIGDVSELLTGGGKQEAPAPQHPDVRKIQARKGVLRAVAVALYITCILPPILMTGSRYEETLGPALMFVIIAIATALMVLAANMKVRTAPAEEREPHEQEAPSPRQELRRAVQSLIWVLGLAAYFLVSFTTMAWHIAWLIFPICAVLNGLIRAIWDLTEVKRV